MLGESLAYVEAVVDVSILIPACFENPLKESAIGFLADALAQKSRAIIPITAIIGAYHIATRYLKTSKLTVKKVLEGILKTKSPALHPHIAPELAEDALNYAVAYDIESWDGYLIALTRSFGAKTIYSIDEQLSKVREVTVINPFPKEQLHKYQKYIEDRLEETHT